MRLVGKDHFKEQSVLANLEYMNLKIGDVIEVTDYRIKDIGEYSTLITVEKFNKSQIFSEILREN